MSEVTPDCLDAEMLAAWMDDGLPPAALETARAHVAGCARCQALVATMVRIDTHAAASAPAPAPSRWWMTWLLPVAGAAAAVTIWFAVGQRGPSTPAFEEQSKQVAAPAPATPVPPPTASEPAPKTLADAAPKRDTSALAKERRQNAENKNEVSARSRDDKDAKKKAVTAAPPAAAAAADANAAAAGVRQEQMAKPAAPTLDRLAAFAAPVDVRSPDPAVRWRLTAGRVEKTIDNGTTWVAQQLPTTAPVVHGVSPARSVCWLVGGNGLVLLTTDGGQIWRRIAFPELSTLASVTATDAVSAVVRTADGRDFVTKDGGITWIQRLLQDF